MIPYIHRIPKSHYCYNQGLKWCLQCGEYRFYTKRFITAFRLWKQEMKKWVSKKLHFKS